MPREKSATQLFGKPLHPFIIHLIDVNMSREHFPPLENPFRTAEYNPHHEFFFFWIFLSVAFYRH